MLLRNLGREGRLTRQTHVVFHDTISPGMWCQNGRVDFEERQQGPPPRFNGTNACALLNQYREPVPFSYRDEGKHGLFPGFGRECEHWCFSSGCSIQRSAQITNSGSGGEGGDVLRAGSLCSHDLSVHPSVGAVVYFLSGFRPVWRASVCLSPCMCLPLYLSSSYFSIFESIYLLACLSIY